MKVSRWSGSPSSTRVRQVTAEPPPRRANPRRLRVGYVSGDFRGHTAAGLIELLLTHHDRNAVHVTCYPNVPRGDETTEKLRQLADIAEGRAKRARR